MCVCWQQLKNACLVSFFGGNGVESLVFKRKSGALIWKVKFRPLLNYHELDWGRLQTSGIAKRMDWTGRGFGLSKVGLGQHELVEFKSTGPSPCPMEAWMDNTVSFR